ncbi:DUF5765 domain-containing protein [Aestuariicoccus sp. MJ-SS9]|uniref:DUF5765 domain-containing protein n=1 Tax=Aestuariicoccus sp. MJ-SS9 TaxID=3079855 RepID=UPI002907F996|nr:DUF5765 domain-containing protein [Aestuariicoccus sp. MJ-SS9]MDU8911638.1 DUF5765 domain-containing protein [Aestuariicoccus sp. MJ-SS9]
MCWSVEATVAMTAVGGAATVASRMRGHPPAIWLTLGYFTLMEVLQLAGYAVIDQCGTPANRAVTWLSYLHIAFQPLFINAFALELVPAPVRARARVWALGAAALATAVMLAQVAPPPGVGPCRPGFALCAEALCTVSGDWHIAWNIPYNGLTLPLEDALGIRPAFPSYMIAVFVVPLLYGAWRFVGMHLLSGPVLAHALTDNLNEMPAVWCLFSIMILLVALSPAVRRVASTRTWWGRQVEGAT